MLSIGRWLDRIRDRKPVIRRSRSRRRRRSLGAWLLLAVLLALIGAIVLLLRSDPASAWTPLDRSASSSLELPASP